MTHLIRREGFGTAPVFLTAICTILGAILFLRLDYAMANLGFIGVCLMLLMGHLVTIPTAMSIAEIATNQKVEGGREYYIISRSFGVSIGGAIGVALYLSQTISAAFYIIAFAEAFRPIFNALLASNLNLYIYDYRLVSIPAMALLTLLAITQRKAVGVKLIYFVASVLLVALVFLLFGETSYTPGQSFSSLTAHKTNSDDFFTVMAICFPAFTGMTAGVGLSSNLKNPSSSIPKGTIYATLVGLLIYLLVAIKLHWSLPIEVLGNTPLAMSEIAVWGSIIPFGLAAATISSAIGSVLVAPRTLQAIANDEVLPSKRATRWLKRLQPLTKEPINATIITCIIAAGFVIFIGDINTIAHIVTLCFLITYGGICTISFLEHFTADPAYRPAFKTRWYISLIGSLTAIYLLFRISPEYSILAMLVMFSIYSAIRHYREKAQGLSAVLQGLIFQLNRQLHIFLQKSKKAPEQEHWRPSVVCISDKTFEKLSAFDMLRWISYKYGFGTYIHRIEGYLSTDMMTISQGCLDRMINLSSQVDSNVYVDTFVGPSFKTAVSSVIQLPGMSGKENNMIMFEFFRDTPEQLDNIVGAFPLVRAVGFDICILGSSDKNFGYKRSIDIYLTSNDFENGNLMILLGFIILGHPEWKGAKIRLLAIHHEEELAEQRDRILKLIDSGRLPISRNNVQLIPKHDEKDTKQLIAERSQDACLTIIGIREESIKHEGNKVFTGYDGLGDILFINSKTEKLIG